jgi:hypothetical protein
MKSQQRANIGHNMNKTKSKIMKYRVHRIEVKSRNMQEKLESFLNKLDGEVVSIIPNVRPTFQLMGATAKIDSLLIVEKHQ